MSLKRAGIILGMAVMGFSLWSPASYADFVDLLNYVPAEANAVTVLNLDKILDSPHGMNKHWKDKLAKESADRPLSLPPGASRVVLAARIDLEYMKPIWEMAIVELKDIPSMEEIAKTEGGTVDEIDGKAAVRTSRDAYVVRLSRDTFAVVTPADRQKVTRWLRKAQKRTEPVISPFLKKRTAVADSGGTEIVMALDLADVPEPSAVGKKLRKMETLAGKTLNFNELASAIVGVQGVAIGIRIGDKPFGQVVVDFDKDVSLMAPFAKPLLLEVLANQGAMIEDFSQWKENVSSNTISLKGDMSDLALRQLLMLIEPPTPKMEAAKKQASPGDTAPKVKATQDHFKAVTGYLRDLKIDKRKMKTWGQLASWMEKYARRIDRLPLLNIDPEMLDYGQNVSYDLRGAASALQGMGIKSGVEQKQISASNPNGVYGYTSRYGYGYGRRGFYYHDNSAQKRAARYSTRAEGINAARGIIGGIKNGTVEIRRKMTDRYQVEF